RRTSATSGPIRKIRRRRRKRKRVPVEVLGESWLVAGISIMRVSKTNFLWHRHSNRKKEEISRNSRSILPFFNYGFFTSYYMLNNRYCFEHGQARVLPWISENDLYASYPK
ncbi:hypothetical protein, partial [Methanocrinis sp.]|uniref:hypothetical protein n=1 Tax=Methanocrinis sp. TaxID=3101522 RepID=UPI003D0ADA25